MKRRVALYLVFGVLAFNPVADALDPYLGTGWKMTRLDLELRIDRVNPGLVVQGEITLRLENDASNGPTLWFNKRTAAMRWVRLDGEGVKRVHFGSADAIFETVRYAAVELKREAVQGDTLTLTFRADKVEDSWQLVTREDVAIGSWVDVWYPVVLTDGETQDLLTARLISVPGTTKFDLPGDWIAISDGRLVSRERRGERTLEIWDSTDTPVARSFAAGPYLSAERVVDNRKIRIYLLGDHALTADRLAELLAEALAALEEKLGSFPFAGYGVVEVPQGISTWGAASQQTFIMAKSDAFDYDHGNVPLWSHEMSHGWWGNTVGTTGPGSKMVGEALAQMGVPLVLEALEGQDAVVEFLDFSRVGYSPMQCARGYFQMVDQGLDHPLSTLGDSDLSGGQTHNLADSKGMWVYHMLRRRVGDDVFFTTLRTLIDEYSGKKMSLDDLRRAFLEAAPHAGLEVFFSQWLDGVGAPRFEVSWTDPIDDSVELTIRQIQDAPPFDLELDIVLESEDGSTQRQTIAIDDRETRVVVAAKSPLSSAILDPDRNLLTRRSEYGAGPVVDGVRLAAFADWARPSAYVGRFRIDRLDQTVEVFADDHGLWVRIGDMLRQLFPHEAHRFVTLNEVKVEFKLEDGAASGFTVALPDGKVADGRRVE